MSCHAPSHLEVVVGAVLQVLDVHVQEADLDVAVSLHGDGPAVVGVVGVGSGVQRGCDLTQLPHHIITEH